MWIIIKYYSYTCKALNSLDVWAIGSVTGEHAAPKMINFDALLCKRSNSTFIPDPVSHC